MAVFTLVQDSDVEALLKDYDIGELVSLKGIGQGIENTNYFVETRSSDGVGGHWVLTLFENIDQDELPYFCNLTQHLYEAGFSVPAPHRQRSGKQIFTLRNKPGVLVPRYSGEDVKAPDERHCQAVGAWMASMHLTLRNFPERRPLVRDLDWMSRQADLVRDDLSSKERLSLKASIERYKSHLPRLELCPSGPVHGDLFRDNVLFREGQLSAVIDFYNACDGTWLYDLAVCANDWATNPNGSYSQTRMRALTKAYQGVRRWSSEEERAWPYCLELAALRFWISRLVSKHSNGYQSEAQEGQAIKDPEQMKKIMLHARVLQLCD